MKFNLYSLAILSIGSLVLSACTPTIPSQLEPKVENQAIISTTPTNPERAQGPTLFPSASEDDLLRQLNENSDTSLDADLRQLELDLQ